MELPCALQESVCSIIDGNDREGVSVNNMQSEKTALVIMAAGIGSRFGEGIKQLEPVGMHGEIIMDYSIHDAIAAGFNKIVFIIRKDIKDAFQEIIGNRMEKLCAGLGIEIAYAYQELSDLPEGCLFPEDRKKPWGTGQAVLACRNIIKEPFVVINADDYYGKEAFVKIYDFLQKSRKSGEPYNFVMAGFILENTLSDNGGVTRGICHVDETGYLVNINETPDIHKTPNGAESNGKVIDPKQHVSMNMWGFTLEFMPLLEEGFIDFLENKEIDHMKTEFLIPIYMDKLLKEGKVTVRVLETQDKWFGVTYKEDKDDVAEAFHDLIQKGVYKEELFSDLI